MNAIRIGIREGIMAARSPGLLLGAASNALLWGLGWWLAAPAVAAGFANGAPADTARVIQLWTVTAAVLLPMLVMRTALLEVSVEITRMCSGQRWNSLGRPTMPTASSVAT